MAQRGSLGEMPLPLFEPDILGRGEVTIVSATTDSSSNKLPSYIADHRKRLRARFMDGGANALPDYEMLEMVLFRAIPRQDVKPLARALIDIAQNKKTQVAPNIAATIHPHARSLSARIERLCKHSNVKENTMTTSFLKKAIASTAALPLSLVFIASVTPRLTLAFAHPHVNAGHWSEGGDYNNALTAQQNRLYQAAREGNIWLAGSIIDAGQTPNFVSPGNGTPLIEAVRNGNQDMIALLIKSGADVNLTSPHDGSPLIAAARHGHMDVVQYLVNKGAKVDLASSGDGNPLIATAHAGRIDTAKVLLANGADINAQVPGDETPLINAAQSGHLDMVIYFVENGADASLGMWSDRGDAREWRTPLSEAEKHGHRKVAAYLKRQGAGN